MYGYVDINEQSKQSAKSRIDQYLITPAKVTWPVLFFILKKLLWIFYFLSQLIYNVAIDLIRIFIAYPIRSLLFLIVAEKMLQQYLSKL